MVTTVTNNSPQAINTSLFSLEKMIIELGKVVNSLTDKGLTKIDNIDLDNLVQNGIYYSLGDDNIANKPANSMHNNLIEVVSQDGKFVSQTFTYLIENEVYVRNRLNGGSWTDWVVVSNNLTSVVISVNGKQGIVTLDASDISGFATVATSGSYNDLSNKPTIPTVVDTVADDNSNAVTSNAVYDKTLPLMGPRVNGPTCTSAELCNYIVNNGVATACCSSANITDGPNGNMWYNFLYIPHRNGIGGDNHQYGTLLLFEMTGNSTWTWIKHLIGGTWYEWKTLIQG